MEVVHEIGVTAKEWRTIEGLVSSYPNEGYGFLLSMLRHFYKENIKPGHYACLGYLIGEKVATVHATENLNNSLSLCQRHN